MKLANSSWLPGLPLVLAGCFPTPPQVPSKIQRDMNEAISCLRTARKATDNSKLEQALACAERSAKSVKTEIQRQQNLVVDSDGRSRDVICTTMADTILFQVSNWKKVCPDDMPVDQWKSVKSYYESINHKTANDATQTYAALILAGDTTLRLCPSKTDLAIGFAESANSVLENSNVPSHQQRIIIFNAAIAAPRAVARGSDDDWLLAANFCSELVDHRVWDEDLRASVEETAKDCHKFLVEARSDDIRKNWSRSFENWKQWKEGGF